LKWVGSLRREQLEGEAMVRLSYPPFHVLVTLVDGVPVAIEDACNHGGASLSEGSRDEDCVSCPLHGYVFSLRTGQLVRPRNVCTDQRRFVVTVREDVLEVWDPFQLLVS
jgi:nitrite reductase/ring-hydroxylating ferredoxin subunit